MDDYDSFEEDENSESDIESEAPAPEEAEAPPPEEEEAPPPEEEVPPPAESEKTSAPPETTEKALSDKETGHVEAAKPEAAAKTETEAKAAPPEGKNEETEQEKEVTPLVDDKTLNTYLEDIESQTHREIPDVQKEQIVQAVHSNKYEQLSQESTREARMEFNNQRDGLIREWEEKTGQTWPKYTENVVNERGAVVRREGSNYDAHHVIECSYGGPAEWWNITPARFPEEHQQGIHRSGSPASSIFA